MDVRRRINRPLMVVVFAMVAMANTGWCDFDHGDGTESDPYQINTVEHLKFLADNSAYWDPNIHCELTVDITVPPGFVISPIGSVSTPFRGVFDGAGHTLRGLNYSGQLSFRGLFGRTSTTANISNLSVSHASINGDDYLGVLVGFNDGSINNCHASGTVTGGYNSQNLGGLVGYNLGTISHCYTDTSVTAGNIAFYVGGVVGSNQGGTITNCYAGGSVTAGDNFYYLGGLVGQSYNGAISGSYATGAVTGGNNGESIGGLVGYNKGGVVHCYASGAVNNGTNSVAIGGLIGQSTGGPITNCYWDVNSTGQGSSSGGGTGKTTTQMKQELTFTDWDFTDTWVIMEDQSYPHQNISTGTPSVTPGDVNGDGQVDLADLAYLSSNWLAGTN